MNMWYFNVKSEYRASSSDAYRTNINYVVAFQGAGWGCGLRHGL